MKLILYLMMILFPLKGFCYDEIVHEKIATKAIDVSTIGQYLSGNLNISLNDSFNSGDDAYIASQWIEEGSKLEDVSPRWLNHFYDPTTGSGSIGISSLQWGKGSLLNFYSWSWAREYYRLALTSSTPTDREKNFAYLFQSLGQVMHLVHDLAVPAHVRNDLHPYNPYSDTYFQQQRDMYEKYTKLNATSPSLTYSGYPAVDNNTFNSFDTFWINGDKGLAEFTNRNFYSRDTNEDDKKYPSPFPTGRVTITETVFDPALGQTREVVVKYLTGHVTDRYRLQDIPITHLSAISYFDYEMNKYVGQPGVYTLNDSVHKEYADLLIPRAVGYSAGLLDYFFRGKIDMKAQSGKFVIKNESSEDMSGTFSLYYDDAGDNRHFIASWGRTVSAGGQSEPVTFSMPSSPAPKEKCKFILAFQGTLGNEAGAVVGKKVDFCGGSSGTITGTDKVFAGQTANYTLNWPDAIGSVTWSTDNPIATISGNNQVATLWTPSNICNYNSGTIKITAKDVCDNKTEFTVQAGTWVSISSCQRSTWCLYGNPSCSCASGELINGNRRYQYSLAQIVWCNPGPDCSNDYYSAGGILSSCTNTSQTCSSYMYSYDISEWRCQ